jgi:hypothetical protein
MSGIGVTEHVLVASCQTIGLRFLCRGKRSVHLKRGEDMLLHVGFEGLARYCLHDETECPIAGVAIFKTGPNWSIQFVGAQVAHQMLQCCLARIAISPMLSIQCISEAAAHHEQLVHGNLSRGFHVRHMPPGQVALDRSIQIDLARLSQLHDR